MYPISFDFKFQLHNNKDGHDKTLKALNSEKTQNMKFSRDLAVPAAWGTAAQRVTPEVDPVGEGLCCLSPRNRNAYVTQHRQGLWNPGVNVEILPLFVIFWHQ